MYELRLKKEFELLQMLQTSEVRDYIKIYYRDRNEQNPQWKPITSPPSGMYYPNSFKVTYRFPKMYTGPGRYVRNWKKSFYCTVDEQTLMNPSRPFILQIEGGCFKDDELPFCPHACKTNLCTGSASSVAKSFGIYYFFELVGDILNMNKNIVDTQSGHYNPEALQWWRDKLNFKPYNDIKWPYDLNERLSRQHRNKSVEIQPQIRFGKPASPTIRFGQKNSTSNESPTKIVFGKK